jgi:Transposase IS116/IS110/IS902 family
MRFVGVRSLENQAALMRHKAREMLVSQRTPLLNALRGRLTEVGVIAPRGLRCARELAELVEACNETSRLKCARRVRRWSCNCVDEAMPRLDRSVAKLAQRDETARRLMRIPAFGPIAASAMAVTLQDTSSFAGPRAFAAFLGLTPKQNSSGGKQKLGRISKMGNRNLRKRSSSGACGAVSPQAARGLAADVGEEADREETIQPRRRQRQALLSVAGGRSRRRGFGNRGHGEADQGRGAQVSEAHHEEMRPPRSVCESASLLDPTCTNLINDIAHRSAWGPHAE